MRHQVFVLPSDIIDSYPGLLQAFEMAAEGETDKVIAQRLTEMGFKTAGNQLNGAFSKDTVRGMLTNRFYLK